MKKLLFAFSFSLSIFCFSDYAIANHCGGGHKEIKETTETSTEESKEDKSN